MADTQRNLQKPTEAGSYRLDGFAKSNRTEAEVRAIRARRARLEADLIEEGASAATVARLATDDLAAAILENERAIRDAILDLYRGQG